MPWYYYYDTRSWRGQDGKLLKKSREILKCLRAVMRVAQNRFVGPRLLPGRILTTRNRGSETPGPGYLLSNSPTSAYLSIHFGCSRTMAIQIPPS